jgi:signal transduction histidine kinase
MWEQYRWQVIGVTAAVAIQSLLIAGLLIERRRRQLAEIDSRNRILQVAHLNRTATAGVMSASIAHELNQPLGAILLNTETVDLLLQQDEVDRKQIEEIIAEIRRDDQRAASIIKGLAGFLKKKGDIERQLIDLNDALKGALKIVEPVATRRGISLNTELAAAALPVRVDPVHLQQVVLNLAINAMDAMHDARGARGIAIQTSRSTASEATVRVSDDGPGIPADKLSSIFETFYTTKTQGSGLGLSIARTIVELYGGKIRAENRPGGGATFTFTLLLVGSTAA